MKIEFDAIFALSLEGRFTTQIPLITISMGINFPTPILVDIPDSFFMNVKMGGKSRIAFGKEQSYLALSRSGFNILKDELWAAYSKGIQAVGLRDGHPDNFNDYVSMMNDWYDTVDENTRKECIRRNII